MPRCIAGSGTVILPEMGQLGAGQSPCLECSWVAAQQILCQQGVYYMKFTSYFRFAGHVQVHCWFRYCDSSSNEKNRSGTISLPEVFMGSSAADSLLRWGVLHEIYIILPFCGACPGALLVLVL
jgi:hypothetical protein